MDQLITSIDSEAKSYKQLQEFQSLLPVTEINFVSEHRRLLKQGKVSKLIAHSRNLEAVQLVLMSDCLLVCRTKENDNPNVACP